MQQGKGQVSHSTSEIAAMLDTLSMTMRLLSSYVVMDAVLNITV